MDFSLSQEQILMRDSITRFLRDRYGFEERRHTILAGEGWNPGVWKAFAEELCILGVALPEKSGGYGGSVETMIVMEALGHALVVEPYLETVVIGGGLLKRLGGEEASRLLNSIVSGNTRISFAASEPSARYAPHNVSTRARREGEHWILTGKKNVILAAPLSTHIIVTARSAGAQCDRTGISLFLVERNSEGLQVHDYRTVDDRRASDLVFNELRIPADALLGVEGQALPLIEQVLDEAITAISAEAVGVMQKLLADTIGYAKQRRQFGQPIANFQVLQHRMVDMYMAIEQSVSAVYLATLKLDMDPVERGRAVSAAKATIGKSARFVGQNAVQIHGGMGMTDELSIGHYFKRLMIIENEFGTVDYHLARYAALTRSLAA